LIAILAGGRPLDSLRLGVAMVALQATIGAVNDIVDAPRDAGRKPGKPIPAGLITVNGATAVALIAAATGVVLSLGSGLPTTGVAIAILVIGLVYDLLLKGTSWSWLPFAVGIPLLPVYAWFGAVGRLPDLFVVLVPLAFVSGTALAVANALVDVERDRAAGVRSVATRFGAKNAWATHAMMQATVVVVALASLAGASAAIVWLAGVAVGAAAVLAGVGLTRGGDARRRERGWELEAVGTAIVAVMWIGGLAGIAI
jgi:4-hydroxybenzoate polyprenyltransferase